MELVQSLWKGFNHLGKEIHVVAYTEKDVEFPFLCVYRDHARWASFYCGKNGRYEGTTSRYATNDDVIGLPRNFQKYMEDKQKVEEIERHRELRKDAIMECKKVVLALVAADKKEEGRGAQKCVERLTSLLNGKKPKKVNAIKKASKKAAK